MRSLQGLLALVTVALIAVVVLWEAGAKTAPGPLHPVHAAVDDLADGRACARCHGEPDAGGTAAMAAACAVCHPEIGEQVADRRGLHGAVDDPERCGACHGEHHGSEIAPVGDRAFARAGIEERQRYDHRHVPVFALDGAHRALSCTACHPQAEVELLPAGRARYLGLDQDCAGCHEDVHRGALGADCARCHGQVEPFAQVGEFRHRRFALDGGHRGLRCDACHAADGPASIASLAGTDPEPRGCVDCHGAAHAPGGTALQLAADTRDCGRCHDPEQGFRRPFDAADHEAAGAPLRGAHQRASCAACHGPERAAGGPRTAPMERCADCHPSPHREAFTAAVVAVSGVTACAACHEPEHASFAAGRVEPDAHRAVGFPATEPHRELDCAACHGAADGAPDRFAARFPGRSAERCEACHRDPHGGQFARRGPAGACLACHAAERFVPSRFGLAAHEGCGFVLDGAHRAVACSRCHSTAEPGRPVRYVGTPGSCAACHEDPHRGRFDRGGRPESVDGRDGCARCHETGSFRELRADFDHGLWTGHRLEGAHARADCAACHGRAAAPDALGKTLGAAPTACAACHEDPHAGQFARREAEGRRATDCARCHTAERGFDEPAFDHDREARFALDATHRGLACAACHPAVPTAGGGSVVRYRPLGIECTDCHGGKERRR
jgi:hypothetical protein